MSDSSVETEAWRDVPVTFGELYDILGSMQIGVNGSVGYTHARWQQEIKTRAVTKLGKEKLIAWVFENYNELIELAEGRARIIKEENDV